MEMIMIMTVMKITMKDKQKLTEFPKPTNKNDNQLPTSEETLQDVFVNCTLHEVHRLL